MVEMFKKNQIFGNNMDVDYGPGNNYKRKLNYL